VTVDADGVILDSTKEESLSDTFSMTTEEASIIVDEILQEYVVGRKPSPLLIGEIVCLLFRIGLSEYKGSFDHNFEPDTEKERAEKTLSAVVNVIDCMVEYNLTWKMDIIDVLIEEVLLVKDIEGLRFLMYIIREGRFSFRTSTFNKLLMLYAENGDSESANSVVASMRSSNSTLPNKDTWLLLLTAGNKSKKGHYYNQGIFKDLLEAGLMRKDYWDKLAELAIFTDKSPDPVISTMIENSCQPDQETLFIILKAYLRKGDLDSAMKWYKRLIKASKVQDSLKESFVKRFSLFDKNTPVELSNEKQHSPLDAYLPPPGRRVIVLLLEALRDKGRFKESLSLLDDMRSRPIFRLKSIQDNISKSVVVDKTGKEIKVISNVAGEKVVIVKAMSNQAEKDSAKKIVPKPVEDDMFCSQKILDANVYSLVIESCIIGKKPELGLKAFSDMEKDGFVANRRIYSLLIRIFGLLGDVDSALGVFEEMRQSISPDIACLQSVLEVCMKDPVDLRQAALLLERMANDGVDLDMYSHDILMQAFPDASALSEALELMQSQKIAGDVQVAQVSLSVLSCLVQCCRQKKGLQALVDAVVFLGRVGIRLDKETMEYFTIPEVAKDDSPLSTHYYKLLLPHKEKMRSLMDIEMPSSYRNSFDAEDRFYMSPEGRIECAEPYFESGKDSYSKFSKLFKSEDFVSSILDLEDEANEVEDISVLPPPTYISTFADDPTKKRSSLLPKSAAVKVSKNKDVKEMTPRQSQFRRSNKGGRKSQSAIIENFGEVTVGGLLPMKQKQLQKKHTKGAQEGKGKIAT
jgi:pentatricopeptide repeat protein